MRQLSNASQLDSCFQNYLYTTKVASCPFVSGNSRGLEVELGLLHISPPCWYSCDDALHWNQVSQPVSIIQLPSLHLDANLNLHGNNNYLVHKSNQHQPPHPFRYSFNSFIICYSYSLCFAIWTIQHVNIRRPVWSPYPLLQGKVASLQPRGPRRRN